MASESGGKKVASFSSMRQPPLTKQLKKILSEYPDGGQIIKELVQNAEDAGAAKVELVCDERDLKTEIYDRRHEDYNKFFEGQALCVYNDAVFTAEDWEGIRMIDSSVKEDDRLKVGRFGQGFKSVFHLTDYPCILSGDTLLLVDPQQQRDKVNAMMEVKSLQEYEGIDIDAFLNAFEGMFGITRDLTRNGKFPGTLFRFPLRRMPSELSSNTYSREKLLELFEIFEGEASSILLFLRNLECISLHVRTNDRRTNILTDVKISNIQEIKRPRSTFNRRVSSLPKSYRGSPIPCCLNLVIEYNNYQRGKQKMEISGWIVVNYFMGGNASEEFQSLIEDPELQLSPYVGVAAPVDQTVDKFDGHVFCFLPLPKEGAKLTGLPVHVNGYFALNQSRHHLKWATDEQIGHSVGEKAIRWNEKLIQEALPLAYKVWFEKAVEYSSQNTNNEKIVSNVHRAFPNVTLVQPNWSSMLGRLFTQLKTLGILFSLTNRWVNVQNAYLIDEDALNKADYKDTIIKTARLLDIDCVVVNKACYNALSNDETVHASHFTPSLLASKLRQRNILPSLNDREKLHILEYLLTDGNTGVLTDGKMGVLEDVPLLPLQSGKWAQFMPSSKLQDSCIYMASLQQISLCAGMEDRFIRQAPQLPDVLKQHLQRLCERGEFQIRMLQSKDLETLLEKLLQQTFPLRTKRRLKSSTLSIDWLKALWQYLLHENKVSLCKRVPLFPLLEGGSWNNPDVVLICLTQTVILKETGKNRLPEEVFCCLKALDIDVITSLPSWIPSSIIEPFIQNPSRESVSDVLASIAEAGDSEEKICSFNSCNETNRYVFMQYMTGIQAYAPGVRKLLGKFQMFRERSSYNGKANMTSLQENDIYISFNDFPVRYPLSCLDGYDKVQQEMLMRLDGKEMQLHEMLRYSFDAIKRSEYTDNDVKIVMTYFISHYRTLQYTVKEHFPKLVAMAKEIPFLMCSKGLKTPSDLFNPLVLELQELFTGQDDVFPKFTDTPDQETINIYQDLGLKSEKHVTAVDLLHIARLLDKWSQTSEYTDQTVRTKSRALVHHLCSHPEILREKCEGREMKTLLENISFIEYERNRPPSYPSWMPWFTQNSILCKPREAKSSCMQFLVGSVMPTVAHTSEELDSVFGWQKDPLSSQVICQLMNVTKHHGKKENTKLLVLLGHLYEWLRQCNETDFGQLRNEAIVWNGEGFSKPTHVIVNETIGDVNLRPYFYFIPDTMQEYVNFFERIGCHSQQSIPLLIQTLSHMQNQASNNLELNPDPRCEDVALKVVEKLAQRCDEIPDGYISEILIPLRTENECPLVFKPISDCTYDRNPEGSKEEEDNRPIYFVHERISEDVARRLNIKRKRNANILSKAIPFGQKEDLVIRLKGLLKAYPRDESVLNELLQNADDAGATELHFIKDYRTHCTDGVLINKNFQGPALCVFNNSYFTEGDLEGIQNLGYGSKRLDLTTTGLYGVGFNAVYHLTDTPSFMSKGPKLGNGGVLCIFDPTCKNIEYIDKTEPGMRFNVNDVRQDSPCELLGFSESDIFQTDIGTMFRFPLRKEQSPLSDDVIDRGGVDRMLNVFAGEMKETLLFLKNIKSIKISDITSGELKTEYRVSCSMSDVDNLKKARFNEVTNSWTLQALTSIQSDVQYVETITDSEGFIQTWFIGQKLGASSYPDSIGNGLQNNNLCHLPVGGVALPFLDYTEIADTDTDQQSQAETLKPFSGKAFAILPLPVNTGLPVHVNGHFALDHESRRDLWKEGSRLKWNEFLRKHVIVPCLVSAISYFKQYFTPEHKNHILIKKWEQMNRLMKLYHNTFPFKTDETEGFWKHLIGDFYEYVQKIECPIFPVINTDQFGNLITVWVPLQTNTRKFCAVFNSISEFLPKCDINRQERREHSTSFNKIAKHLPEDEEKRERKYNLEKIFKALGMQLVQTPRRVFDTIKSVVAKIYVSDPSFVMTFLRTFREKGAGTCEVGDVECHISTTNFLEPADLKEIVAYIATDEHFCQKITGLPIILTADGIVRECSTVRPVYHSEYFDLLPHSADKFLHKILLPVFLEDQVYEICALKHLEIQAFVDMLPDSVPALHTNKNVLWNKVRMDPVSQNWLLRLYNFLYSQSSEVTRLNIRKFKSKLFHTNFEHFKGWAVVPSKKRVGTDRFELVPFDKAFSVFDDTKSDASVIRNIHELNIPTLDKSVFYKRGELHVPIEVLKAVSKYLASTCNPYNLLECLLFNTKHLMSHNLSTGNAIDILNFFDRNLCELKRENNYDLPRKLKLLLLFMNQHVMHVTNFSVVVCENEEFPQDGIKQWKLSTGTVVLPYSEKLVNLYIYLNLEQLHVTDLYGRYILRKFEYLPSEYWLAHLTYLREALLCTALSGKYSRHQEHLIEILKQIPFVCVNGKMKRASELYDESNRLFKCMLNESMFPSGNFTSDEWKPFLILLGLTSKASESHILEFARDIEAEEVHGINDSLLKKSELVQQRFIDLCNEQRVIDLNSDTENVISDHTLKQLKTIRFIVPNKVQKERIELARQFDDGLRLIAFENSVIPCKEILCWTSMNILPDTALKSEDSDLLSKLGVHESPPVKRVILHFQNILEPLGVKIRDLDKDFVSNLLEELYCFLMRNLELNGAVIKTCMEFTPLIYLPNDQCFVKGSSIVVDLRKEDEIKPYLYKSPSEFGKFNELFIAIGAHKEVTCNLYISILAQLKQSVQDAELKERELRIAAAAIRKLLFMITSENVGEVCSPTLFLPNKAKKLTDSKELIVCNNDSILERIQIANLGLNIFMGFCELHIYKIHLKRLLLLPESLQPQFLTSVIKEKIVTDPLVTEENCTFSQQIEDFIHSEELLEGILRILYHENQSMIESFDETLRERLQSVKVHRAQCLQTCCCYNGNVINGSEQTKSCFIQEDGNGENKTVLLYFQTYSENAIIEIILKKDGLIHLIERFTGHYSMDIRVLTQILRLNETPDKVQSLLDKEGIAPYHLSRRQSSVFRRPGMYVEERFHPFLEHDIRPFDRQEYRCVALELEDEMTDTDEGDNMNQEPVFIYVRILREVEDDKNVRDDEFWLKYMVDMDGNTEPVVVPIFRLYRFVRPKTETSLDIEVPGQQPMHCLNFDENSQTCRRLESMIKEAWNLPTQDRKKILKRLMLKWHSDKNPNDQEYCKNVFQFILSVVERLESETGTDTTDGHNSSTYHRMSENINRRATAYARAYHSNFDEYNRSYFTSHFSHTPQAKRPDHVESKRWFEQASNDIAAADVCLSDVSTVDGFNWICYMCHQACEKALKAASYNIDANAVPFGTHSLTTVANGLGNPALIEKAGQLEDRLGEHTRMRYPDRISRPKIPSHVYSEADARFSLKLVREVIDIVGEMIG